MFLWFLSSYYQLPEDELPYLYLFVILLLGKHYHLAALHPGEHLDSKRDVFLTVQALEAMGFEEDVSQLCQVIVIE